MKYLGLLINLLILTVALKAAIIPNEDSSENKISTEEEEELEELKELWFEQYLNHLDVLDNNTFFQRYFEENKFFKPGGPLLLEIGAEGAISVDSVRDGPAYKLAKKLHGKVILLEHRYYGASSPYDNLTAENLYYLSVEQALEDLAYFISTVKRTTPGLEHSKVGVFGCSYSATLATWVRYKFPHLVDAAWASSAPLRAVADFYEYLEVASAVYANVSSLCINTIKKGYDEAKKLLSTTEGEEKVKTLLQDWSCGNVSEMGPSDILGYIRYVVADHNVPPNHGEESCKILADENTDTSSFDKLVAFMLDKSSSVCSLDEGDYPNDGTAWNYQTCTEFGFTVTTTSRKQPFNDSRKGVEEDIDTCIENFGEGFSMEVLQRGIDRINRVYGSVNLKVTKVLSIHGELDPWYRLGLYQQNNEEAPVIFIPGTSHCADHTDGEDEPIALTKAKKKAEKIMLKWLQ